MSNKIDIGAVTLADEEAREQRNVANARWLIDYDGKTLPVTNLLRDGEAIFDPIMATTCVAFDSSLTDGKWCTISNLEPGDVWNKTP